MTKLLWCLALLGLTLACGNGFEKSKPKVQRNQNAQEVDTLSIAEEYLELINDHRSQKGLRSLTYNIRIEEVARVHSKAMGLHTRPFGHMGFSQRCRTLKRRLGSHKSCGEVVAMGQKTSASLFKAWMNSPGHREKIENPDFTMTGLSGYKNEHGVIYWTQMFLEL